MIQELTQFERIAALLFSLSDAEIETILKSNSIASTDELRSAIANFRQNPPDELLVRKLKADFNEFQSSTGPSARPGRRPEPADVPGKVGPVQTEDRTAGKDHRESASGSNGRHPITEYTAAEIVRLLRDESARICNIIIRALPNEDRLQVVEMLAEEKQGPVLSLLMEPTKIHEELCLHLGDCAVQILEQQRARQRGFALEGNGLDDLIRQLRSMTRARRNALLARLQKASHEQARRVWEKLFDPSQLADYSDQSIQRILSEIDRQSLILVMLELDEAARSKIESNLSRRARESLQEEMELMGEPTRLEFDHARNNLAHAVAELEMGNLIELDSERIRA